MAVMEPLTLAWTLQERYQPRMVPGCQLVQECWWFQQCRHCQSRMTGQIRAQGCCCLLPRPLLRGQMCCWRPPESPVLSVSRHVDWGRSWSCWRGGLMVALRVPSRFQGSVLGCCCWRIASLLVIRPLE